MLGAEGRQRGRVRRRIKTHDERVIVFGDDHAGREVEIHRVAQAPGVGGMREIVGRDGRRRGVMNLDELIQRVVVRAVVRRMIVNLVDDQRADDRVGIGRAERARAHRDEIITATLLVASERYAVRRWAELHVRAIAGQRAVGVRDTEDDFVILETVQREARRHVVRRGIELRLVEDHEAARRNDRARRNLKTLQVSPRVAQKPSAHRQVHVAGVPQFDGLRER